MADSDSNRPLAFARPRTAPQRRALLLRLGFSVLVVALLGLLVSKLNLRRDMSRLNADVLSGAPEGNYHHIVARLGERASKHHGTVGNIESAGSADNVRRLASGAARCEVAAGLVQDGTAGGTGKLELLARLPKAESVLFFGREADRITEFAQLDGLKIGVGPAGSGTESVARQLFALPELAALHLTVSNHPLTEELELAARRELDLAMVVMDEDAPLVSQAVRERGLELAGFEHADVIARRIPHLRTGRIGAGEYDAVRLLPARDKHVLRVETLVLGNGCLGRSETIDLLTLLASEFPDLPRYNRDTPNSTGLELSPTAKDYFERGGPELADEYLPWLVDVMPPANWAYVVMGISLLFNAMGFGHRFRLWRIDAARVTLETELTFVFGETATVGDIERAAPEQVAAARDRIAAIVSELEALSARSRRYSLSMLVPMGQEMAYRYQEALIHQTLAALRGGLARAGTSAGPSSA